MKRRPDLELLIDKHRKLDALLDVNRHRFISDWNCDNPFATELLGSELSQMASGTPHDSYIFFDDDVSLLDAIIRFHEKNDALKLRKDNIVAGPGSSSLLAAMALSLKRMGYTDVYYAPPLYHTLYFFLQSFDINLTPIATAHPFEDGYAVELPSQHSVLLMCDPVWYAGKRFPPHIVDEIAKWQRRTQSLVFVDGSFQYMSWTPDGSEASARLDPELTFRLVCPAKALAVPLFRFAYLLHPLAAHDDLLFTYESLIGGSTASDQAFAHRALDVLGDPLLSRLLPNYLAETYRQLVEDSRIRTMVEPELGYFVFAEPLSGLQDSGVRMDGSYFELRGYPNYCRINLLSARRIFAPS